MQTCHVVPGGDEGNVELAWQAMRSNWRDPEAQSIPKACFRIVLRQCLYSMWIKVIPALDRLRSTRFRGNKCLAFGAQLQEGRFVTVIGFVLRHEDYIGFLDLRKMADRTRNDSASFCEPLRIDD